MKAMQPHMGNAGFDPDVGMCEDTPNEETPSDDEETPVKKAPSEES